MARPLDPVSALLKLVDACNQCGIVFRVAAQESNADLFHGFTQTLREVFERFEFELQTEIRRIDGDFAAPRSKHEMVNDPDGLETQCESVLRTAVFEYEAIDAGYMPAHARAMVQRQSQTVHQLWEQFDKFQSTQRAS
jgi:hypothetical protein